MFGAGFDQTSKAWPASTLDCLTLVDISVESVCDGDIAQLVCPSFRFPILLKIVIEEITTRTTESSVVMQAAAMVKEPIACQRYEHSLRWNTLHDPE